MFGIGRNPDFRAHTASYNLIPRMGPSATASNRLIRFLDLRSLIRDQSITLHPCSR